MQVIHSLFIWWFPVSRQLVVAVEKHFPMNFPTPLMSKVFTCLCGQEITTRAQKLLERFNLTYCHCSNKQSGWCQMQKILLNNSDQSLRLISMNKYHDLRRHVDRRHLRLCEDCNKTVWRCAANWLKQKDVNVHAVLYQLLKCEVKQNQRLKMASTSALTHTFRRASHQSDDSTAGRGVGLSELTPVWICCCRRPVQTGAEAAANETDLSQLK